MKKIIYYILLALVSFFSMTHTSCISSEETNYMQAIDNAYALEPYKEYRLAPGDIITCFITCSDREFSFTFNSVIAGGNSSTTGKALTVYEDGTVIIPFFGTVKVSGQTLQEAEAAIQKKMQESIVDAQVKISLANNFFYILSDNKRGSFYVYKDNMTIYQALAISGQTTETMDISKVSIVRKDIQGNSVVKTFDLRSQNVIQSEYYYIQPNDVIYFPTNKNAFFNITSLGSFFTTIMTPLTFLLFAATYKF